MLAQGISHPSDLLAGFIAVRPSAAVPELIMAGQQWGPRGQRIARHAHDVWEFYYQARGVSRWKTTVRAITLEPGGLFAVPPGMQHEMTAVEGDEHEYFFAALELLPALRRLGLSPEASPPPRLAVIPAAHAAGEAFRALVREISLARPLRDVGLRLALDGLALEVLRWLKHPREESSLTGMHPAVERAARLMEQDLAKNWRLETLAKLSGVSAGHLGVLFRREMGTSPIDFLLEKRMERARQLLQQGRLSVTRIAQDLGFSSSQHFAGIFRQRHGCAPTAFRCR